MNTSLKQQVKAELLAGQHAFNIHPQSTGYIGEMVSMSLPSYDIEFSVNGHLTFEQESKAVDPKESITVEAQLYISGISVYKKKATQQSKSKIRTSTRKCRGYCSTIA